LATGSSKSAFLPAENEAKGTGRVLKSILAKKLHLVLLLKSILMQIFKRLLIQLRAI
jgi:ribosomal protein L7Ae-like RNA K-turn-binding protein